ncbi:uncharacterized protein [Euwallacea fornicatus]|uniref:uncharacterized protein n=1 Tax=Euwallacea fornicatus TaxID=995702 RepID=UPI00338F3CA9
MSINRVQKLLFSEYCDFQDLVLIESPFAQTTKDGRGLRQVHLGLTPSKLILATDVLPWIGLENVTYNPFIDPEIETFELIAIYPVECVNLSIYRKKRRQALKAHFCNNRVFYFELGGFERRGMFWNLWCEKVKFLCPADSGTSRSETSIASSTTGSSLYLVDKKVITINGVRQVWCKYGPNSRVDTHLIKEVASDDRQSLVRKWTDRYLYLGKDLQESSLDYKPITKFPCSEEFVRPRKKKFRKRAEFPIQTHRKDLTFGDRRSVQVNRFRSGVYEGCNVGLYLTLYDYENPLGKQNSTAIQTTSSESIIDWKTSDLEEMAETALRLWEYCGCGDLKSNKQKLRHRRRYGFAPNPYFLYGIWPSIVSKWDRTSLQMKRVLSDVNLRIVAEKGLKLPVSKRELFVTISNQMLAQERPCRMNNTVNDLKKPVIFFWTPGYSYRPISAKNAYSELQQHLMNIRNLHEASSKCKRRKCNGRHFLKRFGTSKNSKGSEEEDFDEVCEKKKRKHCFILHMLGTKFGEQLVQNKEKRPHESSLRFLKRMVEFDVSVSAWDLDSTTLAQQLTMIDKELFLKVSSTEMGNLLWQRSVNNAPNIAAIIEFSYRISCLIASEILKNDTERGRARLMARFINVANKCHKLSNFHSCRSVLCGLQNPAIFRLRRTWAYVRKKHSLKYQAFEFFCRLYRDPRMPSFQKTFFAFSRHPPYLPYIGHLIAKLFDKIPQYKLQTLQQTCSQQLSIYKSLRSLNNKVPLKQKQANIFAKILNAFSNPLPNNETGEADNAKQETHSKPINRDKTVRLKGLHEHFRPLDDYKDCRKDILKQTVELLEKCQLEALNYTFSCNDAARNFLLKARHFDDKENFFISVCLEAPEPNNAEKNEV